MDIWEDFFTNRKKLIRDVKLAGIPFVILFFIISLPGMVLAPFISELSFDDRLLVFGLSVLVGIVWPAQIVGAFLFGIPNLFKFAWRHMSGWSLLLIAVLFGIGVCYGWLIMIIILWRDYSKFKTSRNLLRSFVKDSGLYDTNAEDIDTIIAHHIPHENSIRFNKKVFLSLSISIAILGIISLGLVGKAAIATMINEAKVEEEARALTEKFNFEKVSGGYAITSKGNWSEESLIIPDTYKGQPVIAIGRRAFKNCDKIVSITMPDTILCIENSAFENCSSLETVCFSSNLQRIALGAFSNCDRLKEIHLPDSLTKIDRGTIVDAGAFEGCDSLKILHFGAGLKEIQYHMFSSCDILETIYIPASLSKIGMHTFEYDYNIKDIYFDGTIEQWSQIDVDESTFEKECNITVHCSDGDIPLNTSSSTPKN